MLPQTVAQDGPSRNVPAMFGEFLGEEPLSLLLHCEVWQCPAVILSSHRDTWERGATCFRLADAGTRPHEKYRQVTQSL
jgi:hypothetical protein